MHAFLPYHEMTPSHYRVFNQQIHEPVLALGTATSLCSTAKSTYGFLSLAGVDIHLVVPYDDVSEEVYQWLVALPVMGIGLDFCGVPGAAHGTTSAKQSTYKPY